jgi:hypothetical protein
MVQGQSEIPKGVEFFWCERHPAVIQPLQPKLEWRSRLIVAGSHSHNPKMNMFACRRDKSPQPPLSKGEKGVFLRCMPHYLQNGVLVNILPSRRQGVKLALEGNVG